MSSQVDLPEPVMMPHQALPKTPMPAYADLPLLKDSEQQSGPSLTPPPSSQAAHGQRSSIATPDPAFSQLSSPPPSTVLRSRMRAVNTGDAVELTQQQLEEMPADELFKFVARLSTEAQDAKMAAAHYKLQHQMAQLESGEAVERMAVEMEMARREIEVLQQAEAQRRFTEKTAQIAPPEDEVNFRRIHVDVWTALTDEIRDLKVGQVHMENEAAQSRRVIEQQENEIASLHDKVLLMRERIKESREQMQRSRRLGDGTPHSVRITPYQTPVRGRYRSLYPPPNQTPRHTYGQDQPQTTPQQPQQQQQEGFAALLQATDIVSQSGHTPRAEHKRGTHSLSSLPTTPSRSVGRPIPPTLYTPQPSRQKQVDVPMTAPLPRKRPIDTSPETERPVRPSGYESDGTVSASDDSEAETEIADEDVDESRATRYARDLLRSPTANKSKMTSTSRGMTQTTLFGPVTKSVAGLGDDGRAGKRTRVQGNAANLNAADDHA